MSTPGDGATGAATEVATDAKETGGVPRWRRILCGVLVVLVCVLAPLSVLAVWTRNTLLNTDQYVDTVSPLAKDPDIQQAVADRVVLQLTEKVDVAQEVQDALPERAAFVAPFVAQGINRFAQEATLKILESDQFQTLWENANRRAHGRVVAVLTGNESGRVETKNGEVTVQLGPIAEKVQGALSKVGVDIFSSSGGKPPEVVLFKSEELTKIQGAVDLLDKLAIWLPILMLVMLITAIAISQNRRRTVLRTAIGIAIGMALLLVIFNVARSLYLDAGFRNRDAAGTAYDQILSFLRTSARAALAVSLVVAIGAWLAGPGHLATRIRDGVKGLVNRERAEGVEQTSVGRFVARYKMALRAVVIGIALLILVILSAPTPLAVLVIVVLVLIALLLIEFLGRGPGPEPAAPAATERSQPRR